MKRIMHFHSHYDLRMGIKFRNTENENNYLQLCLVLHDHLVPLKGPDLVGLLHSPGEGVVKNGNEQIQEQNVGDQEINSHHHWYYP